MSENNWIDDIIDECEHVETPRSWIWWSCCCAISAAMGNNYHLSMLKGAVIVKANLYVILLGESGLGKEFPINNLAKEIVDRAGVTRVIAGRSSIQAIVKELSMTRTRPDKEIIPDARGFIVNGELSTAIIQDPDSLTILTDLYDNKSTWTNLLKGDGAEKLKKPYITCLFGSSPSHFADSIPQVNVEGGYIGRNLIVFEEKKYRDTDLLDDIEPSIEDFPFQKHVEHLQKITSKAGRIIPDTDAKDLFNKWRRIWRETSEPDKTGFIIRVPVHTLKVAMCLCVAEKNSTLVLTQAHIEEAIDRVTALTYSNKKAIEGKGLDPYAAQYKMVLDFLLAAEGNELKRKQLLTKGYGYYGGPVLDLILDGLIEIGWVKRERLIAGKNSDWIITLSGEPLEQLIKFRDAKRRVKV